MITRADWLLDFHTSSKNAAGRRFAWRKTAPPAALRIAAFWRAAGYERWFAKSDVFDALVRLRLGQAHEAAAAGALDDWSLTPEGVLALLILLDQVPRNLFRASPRAFATDGMALALAETAIARRLDRRVAPKMRWFFYLPFEHAESASAQARAVALFEAHGDRVGLDYAVLHRDVIARFGRFPHRNAVLGRASTKAERRFLAEGGFSG